jgi:hypothetical protein
LSVPLFVALTVVASVPVTVLCTDPAAMPAFGQPDAYVGCLATARALPAGDFVFAFEALARSVEVT